MKPVARIALLLAICLVLLAMALPNTAIGFLREHYGWIGRGVNWVESLWPSIDMDHVVAFATVGLMAPLAGISTFTRVFAGLGLLAVFTEALQFWVPGRTPLLSDVVLDVAGGLCGFLMGVMFTRLRTVARLD